MAYPVRLIAFLSCLFFVSICTAEVAAPECNAAGEFETPKPLANTYDRGLLWKIEKSDHPPSYVFGTIHVSDERITRLPDSVTKAMQRTDTFIMEVVPAVEEAMAMASLMYFSDGKKLNDLLSKELFEHVTRLLAPYHLTREAVRMLKPWAALITMSYPPDFGLVLDMQLLELAKSRGARIFGLESLREQVGIFDNMSLDKQLRLLSDTACNYNLVEADFEKMKTLYLARDLGGLYAYGQRYSMTENDLYNELIQKLLVDRNYRMVERMQTNLARGNAFIAIGAMHLAGDEGVLALLEKQNYKLSRIY